MDRKKKICYMLPFTLAIFVICFDQLTKMFIVTSIAPWSIGYEFFNGLIRIVCVYNTGAAFSLGHNLSMIMRFVMLMLLPTLFIGGMCIFYFKTSFSFMQRWFLCGIIGGGISNLIDRFFRTEGVVDFIDIKFFGIFGMERWPTFNVADSAIVICTAALFITIAASEYKARQTKSVEPRQSNKV